MIDHVLLEVLNLKKSKAFYQAALKPLGITIQVSGREFVGFGTKSSHQFWLVPGKKGDQSRNNHVAFLAKTRKAVDEFYRRALDFGGRDNGAPGIRPQFEENYYAAYVLDLAGNNIEAVCYAAPKRRRRN